MTLVWKVASLAAVVGLATCGPATVERFAPTSGIAADVAFLASEELEGRAVGTAGSDAASRYIAQRYLDLGVPGAYPAVCEPASSCGSGFFQVFQVEGLGARNVLAAIPGTDPALRSRYIVVGAHYDHLGRINPSSASSGIRLGADDNASGTAALLELARRLARSPAPTPVLLAHFDAEEVGLVGSREFAEAPSLPLDSIVLMVNLDMVGRLEDGRLTVEVTGSARRFRSVVDSLGEALDLPLRHSATGRSDHNTFSERGVPAIALFTGVHGDYHRTTDTPDRLDYRGIERVVDLAEGIIRATAAR